jgi:hypothetical protein
MIGALLFLVAWLTAPLPCVDDCDTHCSDCVIDCVESCEPVCVGPRCRRVCMRACERRCQGCRRFCLRRLSCALERGLGGRSDAEPHVTVGRAVEAFDRGRRRVVVVEGDVPESAAAARRERDHAGSLHTRARREELAQRVVVGVLRKTPYVQRAVL